MKLMKHRIIGIIGALCIFLSGIIAGASIGPITFDDNIPTTYVIQEKGRELADNLNPANLGVSTERASPSDWIKESQIAVYSNRVVLDIKDAVWAVFTDTNSMDPFFDKGDHEFRLGISHGIHKRFAVHG